MKITLLAQAQNIIQNNNTAIQLINSLTFFDGSSYYCAWKNRHSLKAPLK